MNFSANIYDPTAETMSLRVIRGLKAMSELSRDLKRRGLTLGFVPTMGALHEGHLSLVKRARRENDRVAVSIFVNPLQFGPSEDYRRYPRPAHLDRAICKKAGVDFLFQPDPGAMLPPDFKTRVEVGKLSDMHCGEFRPGHFRGVATIVLKLFEIIRPDRAYFGEKDFQQYVIIRQMARDLRLPLSIAACPTVREKDGLAMSSRNAYLTPSERAQAPFLYRALRLGAKLAGQGLSLPLVQDRMLREVAKIPHVRIDYIRMVHKDTLEEVQSPARRMHIIAAIRIGRTRLIDNVPLALKKK